MAEIIKGWTEYQRKLKALEASVQGRLLEEAARAGAQIVVDAASAAAPRDTGALAKGIGMRVSKASDTTGALAFVGWSRKIFYGLFAEKGTEKQAATPFLGPALESNRERIFRKMREVLIRGIKKAIGNG